MKAAPTYRRVLILLTIAYALWAAIFIYQNSYIALDGQRYVGLFDDAMISMRYAWNLAHGSGLVWNTGERIEGYSNLLMTLLMSLASFFLDKKMAVLAVQILGIPTVLAVAWLARRLSGSLAQGLQQAQLVGTLTFAGVLLYFPLSYWTLLGMETGLLTALLLAATCSALQWLDETGSRRDLMAMALAAGLAFLTRNDAILLIAVLLVFVALSAWHRGHGLSSLGSIASAAAVVAVCIAAQSLFRYVYYGQLVPNTYVLKLTRYPLNIRLIDGTRFVLEFIGQTWPLFLLAGSALWRGLRPARLLAVTLVGVVLAYQVYVGGDAWVTWRLLAPGMPFLIALAVVGAAKLSQFGKPADIQPAGIITAFLVMVALAHADGPFLGDMSVQGPTSAAIANRVNTDSAIAITAMTKPEASIGVIWAGTLPYYADRYAIDFLGKSDARIAQLNADVSGSSGWRNQISIPGHNKYNLEYSIVERKPVYAQAFAWGYDTVRPYFVENYVRVEYHGAAGTKTIFLLKDSPLVCWEACRDQYQIIPWPK